MVPVLAKYEINIGLGTQEGQGLHYVRIQVRFFNGFSSDSYAGFMMKLGAGINSHLLHLL